MLLIYKGRDGQFDAKAQYDGELITVLAGSFISDKNTEKLCTPAKDARKKVNDKGILMEDVTFKSVSTAAQFVSGHSTNGLRAWKMENGDALGTVEAGKGRKPKKNRG